MMAAASRTTRALLGRCLAAAGATRVFGPEAVPGLGHVAVHDGDLAVLLADADGRVNRTGAALLAGGRLRLGAAPGLEADVRVVTEAADLPGAVLRADQDVPSAVELHLDLDLDRPAPAGLEPATRPVESYEARLDPGQRLVVLAGPGVVRGGVLDILRRFAADAGIGVLNTWGAKGVFRWDSPHHLGTAGLQERDFELGGLGDADLVVAVGVDPSETPPHLLPPVDILHLDLRRLVWDPADFSPGEIPRPPLYTDLSAVVMPAYEDDSIPVHPARAARDLGAAVPAGGLVVADPGPAGFWVARTFPTTEPNSVIVPATRVAGFAAAAALVAGLDARPAVGVTTGPVRDETSAVLDFARGLGVAVDLRVWGEDPDVDFTRLRDLVEVAGPVAAWQPAA